MNRAINFPESFIWGVGNSAYQSEGAHDLDGKGESIWDRFCHITGNILDGKSGDVATDFYHRYGDDIALMKELGYKHFRMSIAWSRVMPGGFGQTNPAGIAFYHDLIDCLLENGIQPMLTLYWWDLPQALQDRGGWANRETAFHFESYVKFILQEYGRQVKYYVTLDEPYCCAFIGHYLGTMAPGHRDYSEATLASYHLLLAHGLAVKAFRDSGLEGQIGIALNLSDCKPADADPLSAKAAYLADGIRNRWFLDPLFGRSFPGDITEELAASGVVLPQMQAGDLAIMSEPLDFLGLNYYSPHFYVDAPGEWPLPFKAVQVGKPLNDIGWEIVPEGLFNIMTRVVEDYGDIPFIITGNGNCVNDNIDRFGQIEDAQRIDYMARHLEQIKLAMDDGVKVLGYYAFSFMDNLEWALGYTKRFGLVYADFENQKRLAKKSARWYSQVIKDNGFSV